MLARVLVTLHARVGASNDERGDVPGWVLITAMTAALVLALWSVASGALRDIVSNALNSVSFR
jgi:hypothetical protein